MIFIKFSMPCQMKGKIFLDVTQVSYFFEISIHLLVRENGENDMPPQSCP